MADAKLEAAKDRLSKYVEAEDKILNGQSYTISGRSLTRADLAEVRKGILYWQGLVDRLTLTGRTGPVFRRIIPFG